MGCTGDSSGVSIQFYDANGAPSGAPIYGGFVKLCGQPATPQTPEEIACQGSADWLTLIAVADSQDRLNNILKDIQHDPNGPVLQDAETSCSSRRVRIDMHIGRVRQTLKDRITIASGPVVSFPPNPKVHVVHVKVLAQGATMAPGKPLHDEFDGGAKALIKLFGKSPPAPPSQTVGPSGS
jgi:hypothetical protein